MIETFYRRILDPSQAGAKEKCRLRVIHAKLDVVHPKRQIDKMRDTLRPSKAG